jgi:uncharacterized protein YpmB
MNKKLEWLIIIFMLVILVTLGSRDASADHVAPYQTDEEYQAEITKEMEAMELLTQVTAYQTYRAWPTGWSVCSHRSSARRMRYSLHQRKINKYHYQ